ADAGRADARAVDADDDAGYDRCPGGVAVVRAGCAGTPGDAAVYGAPAERRAAERRGPGLPGTGAAGWPVGGAGRPAGPGTQPEPVGEGGRPAHGGRARGAGREGARDRKAAERTAALAAERRAARLAGRDGRGDQP